MRYSIPPASDARPAGEALRCALFFCALSSQLNELGFMDYAGQRLASYMGGLSWPRVPLHVVSQSSQVLAFLGVFLDLGIRGGVHLRRARPTRFPNPSVLPANAEILKIAAIPDVRPLAVAHLNGLSTIQRE